MLRTQPGVYSVKVALLAERGVVEYDPKIWTSDKLINVGLSFLYIFLS
jgi:Cu+-exporting ATPase